MNTVAVNVCKNICDEDTEVITLYYGKETDETAAKELAESIEAEEWEDIVRMSRLEDYDLYQLLIETND